MQTIAVEPSVYNMKLFGEETRHFWIGELRGLPEKYPDIEVPHRQNFYMLLYVEEANGTVTIDNQQIRLDNSKVVIIKPRCITNIDINRLAIGKVICFTEDFFSLRYNNNILYQFTFLKQDAKQYIHLSEKQKQRWDFLINLMQNEFDEQKNESKKVLRSYLNIILFELERLYKPLGYVNTINHRKEKVQQFESLIDKHFVAKKFPSAYAELLSLSPNYLNKLCREETGATAGEIIRKRVVIEAQRLLYYTGYTVNEIAYKLGFENSTYFITFFKKQTGLTPEQFRKN